MPLISKLIMYKLNRRMKLENNKRGQFGSRIGFILASAGSAVGLGNIWRFPYVAGENGGAVFLSVYLIMVLTIGFSVLLAEFVIGRKTKRSAVGSFRELGGKYWSLVAWAGLFAGVILLSFYGIVGGFTIKYFVNAITGLPTGENVAALAGKNFGEFVNNTTSVVLFQFLFMGATIFIVSKGVSSGIERSSKILMPLLFIIMIALAIRSLTLPGGLKAVSFYLIPDFSMLNAKIVLAAMSQTFFSLSVGIGAMLAYGSYFGDDEPIVSSTIQICLLDTLVAFLSGLIIFPAVFSFGFQPGAGPSLTFITLPAVFSKMPGGYIWALMFFLLLVIASITSSVNLLEISCSYFVDEKNWSRPKAATILGSIIFILGIPSAISLTGNLDIFDKSYMDWMDFLITNLLLPLGGIMMVLFTGWVLTKETKEEVTTHNGKKFVLLPVWDFICKLVAPVAITIVFIKGFM